MDRTSFDVTGLSQAGIDEGGIDEAGADAGCGDGAVARRRPQPFRKRRAALFATTALAGVAMLSLASANDASAQAIWTGAVSDDAYLAGNWFDSVPPISGSNIVFDTVSPHPAVMDGPNSSIPLANSVHVGDLATGMLTIRNGAVFQSDFGWLGRQAGSGGTVTVSGAGSAWTIASLITLGEWGSAALTVEDGAALSSGWGVIAEQRGSEGRVSVTGPGSTWTVSHNLVIGNEGRGFMTIADGGLVDGNFGTLGYGLGSVGQVTVTGAGSTWDNGSQLTVANLGSATLSIQDGGAVSATTNIIGHGFLSQGTVLVKGPSSTWEADNELYVGLDGAGDLVISDGGQVGNTDGWVGFGGSATGAVTVTGPGSGWINLNELTIAEHGSGALTVADGGMVSAAASFIGEETGSRGSALVTGPGSLWATSGALSIGVAGSGALTIADGGTVSSPSGVALGADAGSTGRLNIGAGAGEAAAAPGQIQTQMLHFGAGTGTLTFNHTGFQVFRPDLVSALPGTHAIDHLSGSTVLAGNGAAFNGHTTVSGGMLLLTGTLGGTMQVGGGGVLGGIGTMGQLTILDGGTVAPGLSIGTLTVAGDYVQEAGSVLEAEVDAAGNSDRLVVTGTATLNGGTLRFVPFPDFSLDTPYTVLTAAGGVSGAFDAVEVSGLFLGGRVAYGPGGVTGTVVQSAPFTSVGATANQIAAAAGLDSARSGNAAWRAVAVLGDAATARGAFDRLSGELHASARTALVEGARHVRNAGVDRMRAAFAGAGATFVPVMAYGPGGPQPVAADTDRFAMWGQAFGSWGRNGGDGNAARLARDTGGVLFGGDARVAEAWRIGLLAGYSRADFKVSERASSGTADSYHLGLHGGGAWGAIGLRGGVSYTWHEVDTARMVAFPGFGDRLTAGYRAGTWQAFGDVGWRIDAGQAALEPFANLAHVGHRSNGFTEAGGAAALTVAGRTAGTTFTTLGMRMEARLGQAVMRGALGWRHAFGETRPASTHAFAGGQPFAVAGAPIARNAAVIEAGFDVNVSEAAVLSLSYDGQIASRAHDHGARARFTLSF